MLEDCEIGPVVRVSTIVTALGVAVTVTCYCKSKRLPARAIDRGEDIATTAHILDKEKMLKHIIRVREVLT